MWEEPMLFISQAYLYIYGCIYILYIYLYVYLLISIYLHKVNILYLIISSCCTRFHAWSSQFITHPSRRVCTNSSLVHRIFVKVWVWFLEPFNHLNLGNVRFLGSPCAHVPNRMARLEIGWVTLHHLRTWKWWSLSNKRSRIVSLFSKQAMHVTLWWLHDFRRKFRRIKSCSEENFGSKIHLDAPRPGFISLTAWRSVHVITYIESDLLGELQLWVRILRTKFKLWSKNTTAVTSNLIEMYENATETTNGTQQAVDAAT